MSATPPVEADAPHTAADRRSRRWLPVLGALIGALAGVGAATLLPRAYRATAELRVVAPVPPSAPSARGGAPAQRAQPAMAASAASVFANTQRALATSRAILAPLLPHGAGSGRFDALRTHLDVRTTQRPAGLRLTVSSRSPGAAALFANRWAEGLLAAQVDRSRSNLAPTLAALDARIADSELRVSRIAEAMADAPVADATLAELDVARLTLAALTERSAAASSALEEGQVEAEVLPDALRAARANAAADLARWQAQYGADYPAARAARAERDRLDAQAQQLLRERRETLTDAEREAKAAEATARERVRTLEANLAQLETSADVGGGEDINLPADPAARARRLDEERARLARWKAERLALETRALVQPRLRLAERAAVPSRPARPIVTAWVALGSALGAIVGALSLMLRTRAQRRRAMPSASSRFARAAISATSASRSHRP